MRTAPRNEGRTFSVYVAREGTHQLSASANADRPSGYDSSHDRSPSDLGWRNENERDWQLAGHLLQAMCILYIGGGLCVLRNALFLFYPKAKGNEAYIGHVLLRELGPSGPTPGYNPVHLFPLPIPEPPAHDRVRR